MLQWLELMATRGVEASAPPNKLVLWQDLRDQALLLRSSPDLRGGEGKMGKEAFVAAFGSSSSAAHRRPRAATPSTLTAERRLLQVGYCQLFFNLQVRAPLGRPSCSFRATSHIIFDPSGHIPGVEDDGCASRLRSKLGGEGTDVIFIFRSRVLFAFLDDLFVIYFYVEVLLVSCNPTDDI
jgi:hypothetical protein